MANIRRSLRNWSVLAHTWIGLSAGLLFCVLSISGAIIVFRPQIEMALAPRPVRPAACTGSRDADAAVRVVEEYAPGSRVDRIAFPSGTLSNDSPSNDSPDVWRFQMSRDGSVQHLAYDACTQRVLGAANVAWVDWLVDLHHNLLMGRAGRRLTGTIGVALLLMSLSGFLIWLVSNPRWRTAFRINTKVSLHRFAFDAHRSLGLVAMAVILTQSATGIWLAYPDALRGALGSIVAVDSKVKAAKKKDKVHGKSQRATISALILAVRTAMPDGKLVELRLPDTAGKSVQARVWRAGDPRAAGNNTVTLNASTATVISIDKFADYPPAGKAVDLITPIHYGEWGGLGARVLLAAAGLMIPVLLISGVLIWWLPKRLKARKVATLPSAEPVAVTS
jgi:uncharacterized iron-regulated membrane protein